MVNSRYSNGQQYNSCVFVVPYDKSDKKNSAYKAKVRSTINCQDVHDWPANENEYEALAMTLQGIESYQCPELNSLPNTPTSDNNLPNMFGDETQDLSLMDGEMKMNVSANDVRFESV